MATSSDDAVWLARLRADDQRALAELMHAYAARLVHAARVTLRADAAADDVVQSVFIRLWEHRATLEIRGSLFAYLLRAVRYAALNVLRHERSQAGLASAMDASRRTVSNAGADAVDAQDVRTEIHRALASAAPQCREIFLLNWEAELSYPEIAELLEISMRTVYNQMHRAMRHLAERMPRPE